MRAYHLHELFIVRDNHKLERVLILARFYNIEQRRRQTFYIIGVQVGSRFI